ncbi:MAG: Arc family DNA-binding protein [Peptococcaceae bacterium]|nr:Arc family DNA-binding protein [Peptococcaceae bacterium]
MSQPAKKERKQIVLRLSPELYDALVHWAEDEFRSINGQIEFLLTDAVRKAGREKKNQINNEA